MLHIVSIVTNYVLHDKLCHRTRLHVTAKLPKPVDRNNNLVHGFENCESLESQERSVFAFLWFFGQEKQS